MKIFRPLGCSLWVIAIILGGILTFYSLGLGERVLEVRDIGLERIMEVKTPTSLELKLKGQTFLSIRRISDIRVVQKNDALVILVYMSVITGKSGYLDYSVSIPNSIKEIKFGNNRAIIWERGEKIS